MSAHDLLNNAVKSVKLHSPGILTGLSVAGVVTTAYLTARASYQAAKVIEEMESTGGTPEDSKERVREAVKATWPLYVAPAISGAVTIGCIVASSKASANRTAAAVTAYSLTEKAFSEYKEHVVEQFGKTKETKLRDAIAQKKVDENPPPAELPASRVALVGKGNVKFMEMYTGRYFMSDMEEIQRAVNIINAKALRDLYVSLDDFYDIIDLQHTSHSFGMGWNGDKLLELSFHAAISPDQEPVIVFEYSHIDPI